jgi:CubicO group peptidase (beta-lactamase class C family)
LSEFDDGCKKHLRIRDLLTMSSGLAWDESYINPFGKTAKAYYGRHLYHQMMHLKVAQTPGYTFRYLSANSQLLGLLLEKATKKSLSQYATEKLWQPLGAEHDALWSLDRKNGDEKAYCNFNATARDFARIGMFCLHNGNWKTKQLLSLEYMKQSFTPAKNLTDKDGNSVDFYGYQWWMMEYKNMKINMACGLYGQYIIMIPEKNLVIVRLGHRTSKESRGHFNTDVYSYIEAGLSIAE